MHLFRHKIIAIPLLTVLIVAIVVFAYLLPRTKLLGEAYMFAYPLVLMEHTLQATQQRYGSDYQANSLMHVRAFPDHTFRSVVRANNDTLYSISWMDLTKEPVVLSVPDMGERYYVMPLMDAYTNVFAAVGTRTLGNNAHRVLIAGPDWQGEAPADIVRIDSPTNMVWMIGRIETQGLADILNVAEYQEQLKITQLSEWPNGLSNPSFVDLGEPENVSINPSKQVRQMGAQAFVARFNELIQTQPPKAADQDLIDKLNRIGLLVSDATQATQMSWLDQKLFNLARDTFHRRVHAARQNPDSLENGWTVFRDDIGVYGTNYPMRAAIAMLGLGALPPAEAVYPNAAVDADGQALSGQYSYAVHFPAGQTPPMNAFWSITLYDQDSFLAATKINRYLVSSRDDLSYNDDGSLDILIQHDPPEQNHNNWLPSPQAPFSLTMRIYYPKEEFLEGQWQMPPIENVGQRSY